MDHLEIERKFLIRMPSETCLAKLPSSEIEQIYILSEQGKRERIRRRTYGDRCVFSHTSKERISDLTRIELEREISEQEYEKLKTKADQSRHMLHKTRFLYEYLGQCFEIDVFPFWKHQALMELELKNEEQPIRFPPDIELIAEVTADKRYTNSSIAREIP